MIAKANARHVRISPYKLRLVANLIRGKKAEEALRILPFVFKKGAKIVEKVLKSAVANAINEKKGTLHEDELIIESIQVNGGPILDRFKPGPQGRIKPFVHRTSHLIITLDKVSK